jgi:hypothetical protein
MSGKLSPTQRILEEIPYGQWAGDRDVLMIRYHINESEEIQCLPIDLTKVPYKWWQEAITAALPLGFIAWSAWTTEFRMGDVPWDSEFYVPEDAECVKES